MIYRMLIAGVSLAGLSACGGGGTGELAGSFAALQNRAVAVENSFASAKPTDVSSLPSGTSTYDGYVILADEFPRTPGQTSYASIVSLTADFNGNEITGTADEFFIATNDGAGNPGTPANSIQGSIDFTGDLSGALVPFPVAVSGNLSLDGAGSADSTIDGNINGAFDGPNDSTPQFVTFEGDDVSVDGSEVPFDNVDIFLRGER